MGDSTFGFSGMMRSNGAMIWSNTIMKHCIAIHESRGYSHTSLLSTPRSDASMANPIINKFATKTAVGSRVAIHRYTPIGPPPIRDLVTYTPHDQLRDAYLCERAGPALNQQNKRKHGTDTVRQAARPQPWRRGLWCKLGYAIYYYYYYYFVMMIIIFHFISSLVVVVVV